MPKIALSMIVRNESHCIERCLNSVKSLIDCYLIVDTGSTDDTKMIIRRTLCPIPGEILDREWTNDFSVHRNQALPYPGFHGLEEGDYVLFMDADDELVVGMPFTKDALIEECYGIANMDKGLANFRPHLFKLVPGVRWVGIRHEDIEGFAFDRFHLLRPEQIRVDVHHEGDRSKDENKVREDAIVLLQALRYTPRDSYLYNRYVCLIAQSFMDAGLYHNALQWYEKYLQLAKKDPYKDSLWVAWFMRALCIEMLHSSKQERIDSYMQAIEFNPERIEPYFLLAKYLVQIGGLDAALGIMDRCRKVEPRVHPLKHMVSWMDKREPYYQEIKEMIESRGKRNQRISNEIDESIERNAQLIRGMK